MKSIIELAYSLIIGVAVALFIGSGIWAAYPGPKAPDYPNPQHYGFDPGFNHYDDNGKLTEEGRIFQEEDSKRHQEYNIQYQQFEKDQKSYRSTVALVVLIPALISFAAGARIIKRSSVMGEGLGFGGIISAGYALSLAWISSQRLIVFATVTAILAMVIALVFIKFNPEKPKKTKR